MKIEFATASGLRTFDDSTLESVLMGLYTRRTEVGYEIIVGKRGKRALVSSGFGVEGDVQSAFDRFSFSGWPKYTGIEKTPVFVDPKKIAAIEYRNNLPFPTDHDYEGSFLTTLTSNFIMVSELPEAVMTPLQEDDFIKFPSFDPENPSLHHTDVFIRRGAVRAVASIANGKAASAFFSGHSIHLDHDPKAAAGLLEARLVSSFKRIQKIADLDVTILAKRIEAISALEHKM